MGTRLEKNSESVKKRIAAHTFDDEEGEEYEGSKFGGFPEYFGRKKIKLQNLDTELRSSSAKPHIFRGIVAHVNGYTQPSLNDLHRLIVSHGGGFLQYLDGKTTVTHIIAASLPPKKAIEFKRYRIVKPAWVVDSVAAGKILPWSDYRVIGEGVNQRLLGFEDGKVVSETNTQSNTYRDQTDTSWYTGQMRKLVDDIDDDEAAYFPSSPAVVYNRRGSASKTDGLVNQLQARKPPLENEHVQCDDTPHPSSNFEVTASLEHILDQGADKIAQGNLRSTALPAQAAPRRSSPDASPHQDRSYYGSNIEKIHGRTDEATSLLPFEATKPQTAEEHNAMLVADPRIWKSSTANPDFIRQYYSESRLHHLSMWKADLKARFQQMASERTASQKLRVKRRPGARRYVMHVDFDSFFCAVSLRKTPEYADRPTVVAHGNGNGSEIASCNYPARAFGVKNGMWMKKALELCPNLKVLPYDFPAYEKASQAFYEAIIVVRGVVQSVSVDEALVDITSLCLSAGGTDGVGIREGSIWREQEQADQLARTLRHRIYQSTGCTVSTGVGGNILLAKIALRKAKPAGQHQIKPEEVLDFLGELSVQELPGVAFSIGGKLEEAGVKYVKDVRQLSRDRLMTILGPKTGEKIWDYSRGIDRAEVGEQTIRKSVSAEVNWGIRFVSQVDAEEFVQNLCIELQRRLVEQQVKGHQLTMKIMRKAADAPIDPPKNLGHGKCDTFNKSVVLGVATNDAAVIGREAISILRGYGFSPGELRGLGVQMTKLEQVKPSVAPEGSQRKINFASAASNVAKNSLDDIVDEPETPKKWLSTIPSAAGKWLDTIVDASTPSTYTSLVREAHERSVDDDLLDPDTPTKKREIVPRGRADDSNDPIDESSPLKLKATPIHPALAISKANATNLSARKLNLKGNQFLSAKKKPISSTQFFIPSQIDPQVLEELPPDIRSRLLAQSTKRKSPDKELRPTEVGDHNITAPLSREESGVHGQQLKHVRAGSRSNSISAESRPASPVPQRFNALTPSQLDLEVFDALPDDVRAEILASYTSHQPKAGGQTILPQSPRKIRTITTPMKKKLMTPPKKRGRGRPSRAEMRTKAEKEAASHYTQSNFVAGNRNTTFNQEVAAASVGNDSDRLDPDFLSALPEDVRQEVIKEHRQKLLAKKGGLMTSLSRKKRPAANEAPVGPRKLRLPPREPRPTFTTQELSTLPQLRDMMTAWFKEYEDDGPHPDDVAALERYLRRVIVAERDMAKVVSLVKWLDFIVRESDTTYWDETLTEIKETVQSAVGERGLGRLVL